MLKTIVKNCPKGFPFALNIRGIVEFVQQSCFGVFFAKY